MKIFLVIRDSENAQYPDLLSSSFIHFYVKIMKGLKWNIPFFFKES